MCVTKSNLLNLYLITELLKFRIYYTYNQVAQFDFIITGVFFWTKFLKRKNTQTMKFSYQFSIDV